VLFPIASRTECFLGKGKKPLPVEFKAFHRARYSYLWDFGDATEVRKKPHPDHEYTRLALYTIRLREERHGGALRS